MVEQTRGTCVVCGCTDLDCTRCIERTGQRCDWADEAQTLCTACVELTPQIITSLRAAVEAGKAETARLKAEHDAMKAKLDGAVWYSLDAETGLDTHESRHEAEAAAQDALDFYRERCDPEWSEEVEQIEYGMLIRIGAARVVSRTCDHQHGCDEATDYALVDPATYAEPPFVDCGECDDYKEEAES